MDATESVRRFFRKSASLTNALPFYCKRTNTVVYAADKIIFVCDCSTNSVRIKLSAHSDTITEIIGQKNEIISIGLDGKVIVWDIESGKILSKVDLHMPALSLVMNEAANVVLHEHNRGASLFIYDKGFEIKRQIFEKFPTFNKTTALNNHFIVSICGDNLHVYWLKNKKTVRYELPTKGPQANKKRFTCVACHPKDAIIATGNVRGEVMVWWNFTMPIESEESSSLEEDDDVIASETLIESSGQNEEFKLVSSKRVKRSVMHWHSREVTALAFTAEGKHLFSGGLEGVLVKWDLTECFGGVRQRRFFPLLGSPISAISSPGGESEETVVVTLEKNSFLVLNGALQIIFQKSGFCQTPRRWTRHLLKPSIEILPLSSQNDGTDASLHPEVLVTGSMGELQVLDCASGTVTDKFNINRKPHVMCDGLTAPIFSEVQLAAVSSADMPTPTEWLVTYDILQIPIDSASTTAGFSIDNQSRITWWRREKNAPETAAVPGFKPLYGEWLAHLNCPATDLHLTATSAGSADAVLTLLLLRDLRLLIWQQNRAFGSHASEQPWLRASCVPCVPDLIFSPVPGKLPKARFLNFELLNRSDSDRLQHGRVVCLKQPRNVLIVSAGTTVWTFNWIRWLPSVSSLTELDELWPLGKLELHACADWQQQYAESSPETSVATPLISQVAQVSGLEDPYRRYFVASLVADPVNDKKPPPGGLALLELSAKKKHQPKTRLIRLDFNCSPSALAVHPSRALIAMAFGAQCKVFRVSAENGFLELCTFAPIQLLPFCDRLHLQQVMKKKMRKNKSKSETPLAPACGQLESLSFYPTTPEEGDEAIRLAGIFITQVGRDDGRRDLVVYESTPSTTKAAVRQRLASTSERMSVTVSERREAALNLTTEKGILQLAEPIPDGEAAEGEKEALVTTIPRRYKREAVEEMESLLRQVSQYPVYAAPPPEQLLAQLFKKPNL